MLFQFIWCVVQVSKKQAHRPMLVFRLSQLESIDGIEVTEEEATKADVFFIDQLQVKLKKMDLFLKYLGSEQLR